MKEFIFLHKCSTQYQPASLGEFLKHSAWILAEESKRIKICMGKGTTAYALPNIHWCQGINHEIILNKRQCSLNHSLTSDLFEHEKRFS